MEMYRAPHRAEDFGAGVPEPRGTLSSHTFSTARTAGQVVGGWRGKDKTYFHIALLIDGDSFQCLCCFPDLVIV